MPDVQTEPSRFYILDGDRITSVIEDYLLSEKIDAVSCFSEQLTSALEEIKLKILGEGGEVKYCAGDNILFLGRFDTTWCEELIKLFFARTRCTASIGIGNTSKEVYSALKSAKFAGGGKVICYEYQPHENLRTVAA